MNSRRILLFFYLSILVIAASTSTLIIQPSQASPAQALSSQSELPDLVEKVMPGVVNISSTTIIANGSPGMEDFLRHWGIPTERKQSSLGSGFVIDTDGFVITNNHVVANADEVIVTFHDKRSYSAKIIGKDQKLDIALLRIREKGKSTAPVGLTAVLLANSDTTRIGEPVFAVGNPFGLQHTVTAGIISAKNRTIGLGPFDNFLQTDASVNPGNSGGPLFNFKGEVTGINTVIYSKVGQSGGLNFAIPINELKTILPDLKRYGRVPRPWLGIVGERITPAIARHYRLSTEEGIVIYNLVEDGPAYHAKLQQGDIILSIEGLETKEVFDIERALSKHRPHEKITLKLKRGTQTLDKAITLEELPKLDALPEGIH